MCCVLQGLSRKSLYAHTALVVLNWPYTFESRTHKVTVKPLNTIGRLTPLPSPFSCPLMWSLECIKVFDLVNLYYFQPPFGPVSFVETLVTVHIAFQREGSCNSYIALFPGSSPAVFLYSMRQKAGEEPGNEATSTCRESCTISTFFAGAPQPWSLGTKEYLLYASIVQASSIVPTQCKALALQVGTKRMKMPVGRSHAGL